MSLLIDIVQQRDWSKELLWKGHVLQRVIDQHITYYIEEQSFLRRFVFVEPRSTLILSSRLILLISRIPIDKR